MRLFTTTLNSSLYLAHVSGFVDPPLVWEHKYFFPDGRSFILFKKKIENRSGFNSLFKIFIVIVSLCVTITTLN